MLSKVIPQSKTTSVAKALPQFRLEDAPNVVLDTMKRAEDSPDIIIRLYEAYGGHARARLVCSLPMKLSIAVIFLKMKWKLLLQVSFQQLEIEHSVPIYVCWMTT